MYLRPNWLPANTLTPTQFIHEWAHHLEGKGYEIADASRGKPSFPADKDAAKAVLATAEGLFWGGINTSPYGKYSIGEKEFRTKAAQGFENEYGIPFNTYNMIFTSGGQFAIAAIFSAIEQANPNSVIITPSPYYTNHYELAHMFSGTNFYEKGTAPNKFKTIDLLKTPDFRLTGALVKQAADEVTSEGKNIGAFLFCNPMNPLSLVTNEKEWLEIAEVLRQHPETPIILDEAFAEIIFALADTKESIKWSLLHAAPDLQNRTFLMRSGTKALGFSGERLAVMYCPDKFLPTITSLQSRLIGNAPLTSQAGMAEAMSKMSLEKKAKISAYYKQNAEYIFEEVKKLGLLLSDKLIPEGCFYLLINLQQLIGKKIPEAAQKFCEDKKIIENDVDIAISLLHGMDWNEDKKFGKKGLALVPASYFGVDTKLGVMRLSFSPHKSELEGIVAMLRLAVGK
jgi:aspartate/methionine/tyrosine aminotransferase